MTQPPSDQSAAGAPTPDLAHLVQGVVSGDGPREDALFEFLRGHLRVSVGLFLPGDCLEADEVVVESITVVFDYIRRDGGFAGDLVRFAITIARNRCRNILNQRRRRPEVPIEPLAEWIASDDRSPLDHLLAEEVRSRLREAVAKLGRVCRLLLRAFYLEGTPIETIRRRLGLETVQGVYYRRTVCLRKLGNRLMDDPGYRP